MTSLTDSSMKFRIRNYNAAKQPGFEEVIEYQRNCALAILQERDVFMAKPTGSEGILIYQKISLYMNLSPSKGNWTETKFTLVMTPLVSLVKDQTRQLRERNVDAIFLFAENLMRLFRKLQDEIYCMIYFLFSFTCLLKLVHAQKISKKTVVHCC